MPSDTSGSSAKRRSVFSRSPLSVLTKVDDDSSSDFRDEPSREDGIIHTAHPSLKSHRSSDSQPTIEHDFDIRETQAARMRSYSHLGLSRPLSSIGGILSRTHSRTDSRNGTNQDGVESSGSGRSTPTGTVDIVPGKVLNYGEVQTTKAGWKRNTEFFVLTENYILRYRTAKKAAEVFPWVLPISANMKHRRGSKSVSSLADLLPSSGAESPVEVSYEKSNPIALQDILAVQAVKDGAVRTTIELIWLPPSANHASSLFIQFERVDGEQHWLESISGLARNSYRAHQNSLSATHLKMINDTLESSDGMSNPEADLSKIHRVVRRRQGNNKGSGLRSLDDLAKDTPNVYFLLVEDHKIRLIPLVKNQRGSSRSLPEHIGVCSSWSILSLSLVMADGRDDAFDLLFRLPQQPAVIFELASIGSHEITEQLHATVTRLLPNWPMSELAFKIPSRLKSRLSSRISATCPADETFTRVLQSYCLAYDIGVDTINYTIREDVEDFPCLQILPRSGPGNQIYSALELIAIMRAVRYSNFFVSLSFANIALDQLRIGSDLYATDNTYSTPWMGDDILWSPEEMRNTSILFQELRAVVMTGKKLRRLDFTNAINRTPNPQHEQAGEDPGCGILDALYPLLIRQNTNLDWIILNGTHLSTTDMDTIMGLLAKKDCHLRAIELSGCHLSNQHLKLILRAFPTQQHTLEVINISNNPGHITPSIDLPLDLEDCKAMRVVDLSNVRITTASESFIPLPILKSWRLEELYLSKTRMSEASVNTLVSYLKFESSRPLRILHLDDTDISARDIAAIFRALGRDRYGGVRDIHIDITGNRLYPLDPINAALTDDAGPSSLTMRMAEFQKPVEFWRFIEAITKNTTLRVLDIAEALLCFQIDIHTSGLLQEMFARNHTLECIDLSGENCRLETSNLGAGIYQALTGLLDNSTLKCLAIRDQQLGLQGAKVLVDVLSKNNTLQEIHCENNGIPLSALSLLVDALKTNTTVIFLPEMEDSKISSLKNIASVADKSVTQQMSTKGKADSSNKNKFIKTSFKSNEFWRRKNAVDKAVQIYADKWETQQVRLRFYLERNRRIASGKDLLETDEVAPDSPELGLQTWAEALRTEKPSPSLDDGPKRKGFFLQSESDEDLAAKRATVTMSADLAKEVTQYIATLDLNSPELVGEAH